MILSTSTFRRLNCFRLLMLGLGALFILAGCSERNLQITKLSELVGIHRGNAFIITNKVNNRLVALHGNSLIVVDAKCSSEVLDVEVLNSQGVWTSLSSVDVNIANSCKNIGRVTVHLTVGEAIPYATPSQSGQRTVPLTWRWLSQDGSAVGFHNELTIVELSAPVFTNDFLSTQRIGANHSGAFSYSSSCIDGQRYTASFRGVTHTQDCQMGKVTFALSTAAPNLIEGRHAVEVRTEYMGLVSWTYSQKNYDLDIKRTSPAVTIDIPANNTQIVGSDMLLTPLTNISGQCESGSPVYIYIDVVNSFTTPCSNGTYVYGAALPEGSYTLQARQTDLFDNPGVSNVVSVMKDTVGPSVNFSIQGLSSVGTTENVMRSELAQVITNASGTGVDGFRFVVYSRPGGVPLCYWENATPISSLAAAQCPGFQNLNSYTLRVFAMDQYQNKTEASNAFDFTTDYRRITVQSVVASSIDGIYGRNEVLPFLVTFSEPVKVATGATLDLGGGLSATYTPAGSSDLVKRFTYTVLSTDSVPSLTISSLSGTFTDTNYGLEVRTNFATVARAIRVDGVAPLFTLSVDPSTSYLDRTPVIRTSVAPSDPDYGFINVSARIHGQAPAGGTTYETYPIATVSALSGYDLSLATTYTIEVTARDRAGNERSDTIDFSTFYCPANYLYIGIPHGTSPFCIAQKEASMNLGYPTFGLPDSYLPRNFISKSQAISACNSLNSNVHTYPGSYALVDNKAWNSVVNAVLRNGPTLNANVGMSNTTLSYMLGLSNSSSHYEVVVSNPYHPQVYPDPPSGPVGFELNRRSLVLPRNQVIWDFAGNLWEYVSDNSLVTAAEPLGVDNVFDILATGMLSMFLPTGGKATLDSACTGSSPWTADCGIGRVNMTTHGPNGLVIIRGGGMQFPITPVGGASNGLASAVSLNQTLDDSSRNNVGFRCMFTPNN